MNNTASAEQPEAKPRHRLLLSPDDLRDLGIRFSRAQLWKKVKRGEFPPPIKLSTNRSAWVADEVQAWICARMSERAA